MQKHKMEEALSEAIAHHGAFNISLHDSYREVDDADSVSYRLGSLSKNDRHG